MTWFQSAALAVLIFSVGPSFWFGYMLGREDGADDARRKRWK